MNAVFEIAGRYRAAPVPADWRDLLAARIGMRPRRIGTWAELALYGALACLADAGESTLPAGAHIFMSSRHGPGTAPRAAYDQARTGLPMPLLFLQTQPGQALSVLAAHLGWSGNASFVCNPEPQALLRLAAAQSGADGVLLGWVDETEQGQVAWLRLRPVKVVRNDMCRAPLEQIFWSGKYLYIGQDGMGLLDL